MRVIETPDQMQSEALRWAREGRRSALVPTMGALHEGHLALARKARELGDPVVMSVFVNPAQFGPTEDFSRYPRTFDDDCAGAERSGVDVVFAPTMAEIYPEGYETYVAVENLQKPLCGTYRPVFFRGVATVVLKLFNICQPSFAVFGWKDAQQFLLLKKMVKDLNVPVEMVGFDTVRESDGLAMSSRNKYLSPDERAIAPLIYQGLSALRDLAAGGERDSAKLLAAARAKIESSPHLKIQYLELVSQSRLEPIASLEPGNTLVAVAAHLGATRLIDNIRL